MIDEFKKTLKLLSGRKNSLIISSANNQEEINKKIKEYDQYINEDKPSKTIDNMDNYTKIHLTEDYTKEKKNQKNQLKII